MEHELKCWPPYFDDVRTGRKPFEVRRQDRSFIVGDVLLLREWEPVAEEFSGRSHRCRVSYVLDGGEFGIEDGFCVMGIERGER